MKVVVVNPILASRREEGHKKERIEKHTHIRKRKRCFILMCNVQCALQYIHYREDSVSVLVCIFLFLLLISFLLLV